MLLPLSESELSEPSVFAALLSGSSELLACFRLLAEGSFFILFFYELKEKTVFTHMHSLKVLLSPTKKCSFIHILSSTLKKTHFNRYRHAHLRPDLFYTKRMNESQVTLPRYD